MKLNGHFLNNPVAIDALRKLNNTIGITSNSAYRIGKIFDRVMREIKVVGEQAMAIHKKYCLLDPAGGISGLAQGKLEFAEPKEENEKKHDADFQVLLDGEFEEKVLPIPLSDLGDKLTPAEIIALRAILVIPD